MWLIIEKIFLVNFVHEQQLEKSIFAVWLIFEYKRYVDSRISDSKYKDSH